MARKTAQTREETQEKIKKAFIILCRTKDVNQITIHELTKLAEVNRSTFYYYFQDIYELMDHLEQEFLELIEEMFPHIIAGMLSQNFEGHIQVLKDFYQRYQDIYRFFMVEKPSKKVRATIQNYTIEYAMQVVGLEREHLTLQQRLVVEYIANAQFGMISWWLENGQECSVEELSRLITSVNMQGPFPTLLQTIKEKKI